MSECLWAIFLAILHSCFVFAVQLWQFIATYVLFVIISTAVIESMSMPLLPSLLQSLLTSDIDIVLEPYFGATRRLTDTLTQLSMDLFVVASSTVASALLCLHTTWRPMSRYHLWFSPTPCQVLPCLVPSCWNNTFRNFGFTCSLNWIPARFQCTLWLWSCMMLSANWQIRQQCGRTWRSRSSGWRWCTRRSQTR